MSTWIIGYDECVWVMTQHVQSGGSFPQKVLESKMFDMFSLLYSNFITDPLNVSNKLWIVVTQNVLKYLDFSCKIIKGLGPTAPRWFL